MVETSTGNFQAWLKHACVFPRLLGTFAAQTLASQYGADRSAADWRRFGRLPGFTNCKPKYLKPDGLFPFVRLMSHTGEQYPLAEAFVQELMQLYQAREQQREARRQVASLSPRRGPRSAPSLERFRTSVKSRTARRRRPRLLCRRDCGWHGGRLDRTCSRRRLSIARSAPLETSSVHPSHHEQGPGLGGGRVRLRSPCRSSGACEDNFRL